MNKSIPVSEAYGGEGGGGGGFTACYVYDTCTLNDNQSIEKT